MRWSVWSRPPAAAALVSGLVWAATLAVGHAQSPQRAMPIVAARTYSGFYHNQLVAIVGTIATEGAQVSLIDREGALRLIFPGAVPGTRIEAHGTLLDLGRMRRTDPRLSALGLLATITSVYGDRWPRPGEDVVLVVGGTGPPPDSLDAPGPVLRSVVLEPTRFEGDSVTVAGEFRGRNLYADLPEAPTSHPWDFILRHGDAAIWVTGVQPKGRDFVLDPTQRRDTGRWFRVSGIVRTRFGVTWVEARDFVPTAPLAPPLTDTDARTAAAANAEPVEVLFVTPLNGEADVRLTAAVRVQVSRDLDPRTLDGRIRIGYSATDSVDRGEPLPPDVTFTVAYDAGGHALSIRPSPAWQRFREVTVSFLEGIRSTDGAPLAPFTLRFTTGGS